MKFCNDICILRNCIFMLTLAGELILYRYQLNKDFSGSSFGIPAYWIFKQEEPKQSVQTQCAITTIDTLHEYCISFKLILFITLLLIYSLNFTSPKDNFITFCHINHISHYSHLSVNSSAKHSFPFDHI